MTAQQKIVKRARDKLGLEDFAARLGVSRQTVWRYESGDPIPKRVQLAIAALLANNKPKRVHRS